MFCDNLITIEQLNRAFTYNRYLLATVRRWLYSVHLVIFYLENKNIGSKNNLTKTYLNIFKYIFNLPCITCD